MSGSRSPTTPNPTPSPVIGTRPPTAAPGSGTAPVTTPVAGTAPPTTIPPVAPAGVGSGLGGGIQDPGLVAAGVIRTNFTILHQIQPNCPQSTPNEQELTTLSANTINFYTATFRQRFPSFTQLSSVDFSNMQGPNGGWFTTNIADASFNDPVPTTQQVVDTMDNFDPEQGANYTDYVLNFVRPSGPYFACAGGLELTITAVPQEGQPGQGPPPGQ